MRTIDFYWFLSCVWETGIRVNAGLITTDAGVAAGVRIERHQRAPARLDNMSGRG